jgi:hypothetical protein
MFNLGTIFRDVYEMCVAIPHSYAEELYQQLQYDLKEHIHQVFLVG